MTVNGDILRLIAVAKSFCDQSGILRVLDGVHLSVRAGEIVLLQGPSGSGKTTLLEITGCLLRADTGRVELQDREINGATGQARTAARRQHLGFVFQHFHLLDALTVRDNVALALRLKRQVVDMKHVDSLLSSLGLAKKTDKRPRDLSGGEKQRVAFARALVGQPALLLADEPTSQLDAHAAESIAQLMRKSVKGFGCAAIITTHDTRLHPVADRICTLREGRIHE